MKYESGISRFTGQPYRVYYEAVAIDKYTGLTINGCGHKHKTESGADRCYRYMRKCLARGHKADVVSVVWIM